MGAWLHDHKVGVFMHDPHTELEPFIADLTKIAIIACNKRRRRYPHATSRGHAVIVWSSAPRLP